MRRGLGVAGFGTELVVLGLFPRLYLEKMSRRS